MKQPRLLQTFILSTLFSLIYLAVVLTLTGKWQQPVLQDDIPDLAIFVISITALSAIRGTIKRKGRKLIVFALVLNALVRLVRVPMGELYTYGMGFNPLYWNVIWILYFIAILMLLIGLKKAYD